MTYIRGFGNIEAQPNNENKPKCFSTLKPIVSCVGCEFGIECLKTHEQKYLSQIHRG